MIAAVREPRRVARDDVRRRAWIVGEAEAGRVARHHAAHVDLAPHGTEIDLLVWREDLGGPNGFAQMGLRVAQRLLRVGFVAVSGDRGFMRRVDTGDGRELRLASRLELDVELQGAEDVAGLWDGI